MKSQKESATSDTRNIVLRDAKVPGLNTSYEEPNTAQRMLIVPRLFVTRGICPVTQSAHKQICNCPLCGIGLSEHINQQVFWRKSRGNRLKSSPVGIVDNSKVLFLNSTSIIRWPISGNKSQSMMTACISGVSWLIVHYINQEGAWCRWLRGISGSVVIAFWCRLQKIHCAWTDVDKVL